MSLTVNDDPVPYGDESNLENITKDDLEAILAIDFSLVKLALVPSLMIMVIIKFIAFLAGALPARRASKLDPIIALKTE